MLLDRKSLSVVECVSKDEIRPALQCVCVRPDGTTVASDGYQIAIVAPDPEGCNDSEEFPRVAQSDVAGNTPKENILLRADACRRAMKALPKKTTLPILAHALLDVGETEANGHVRMIVTDLENTSRIDAEKVDSTFPKYEQVIPTGEAKFTIGFNARMLADLLYLADSVGGDVQSHQVTLEFYSPVTAAKITAGRFTGIIMPLRLSEG